MKAHSRNFLSSKLQNLDEGELKKRDEEGKRQLEELENQEKGERIRGQKHEYL